MGWKILTAIKEAIERTMETTQIVTQAKEMEERVRRWVLEHWIVQQQRTAIRFLDVQRLMMQYRLIQLVKLTPYLTVEQRQQLIRQALLTPVEQELWFTKRLITVRQLEEEQLTREHLTRLERRLEEVEELLLYPSSVLFTEHQVLCLMEKYLWTTLQEDVKQILQKIIKMCEAQSWQLEPIIGKEALQKLMLQLYVTAFLEPPYTLNMLGLRLTALTEQFLYETPLAFYITGVAQAEMLKTKALLQTCEKRRLETKKVASGKKRIEYVPTKFTAGVTESYTGTEKIGLFRDLFGKELFWYALRYAYRIPFWLRRWFAIHTGMPENHPLARYFGIGCIPSRRSLRGWKKQRYPEVRWLYYHRDEYVRNLIRKYQSRYRAGYSR